MIFPELNECPGLQCNEKFHNRIHKSPPFVPSLSQINPLRAITTYVFEGVVLNSPRVTFPHMLIVAVTRRLPIQSPKSKTDLCRLYVTAHSVFSELPCVSWGRRCYQQPLGAPCCYARHPLNPLAPPEFPLKF